MTTKNEQLDTKKKRVRSPNFPSINLEEAVKRLREFYEHEDRHWANVEVASRHWGYSNAASGGALVVAALTAFGLLEDEGARENRKVRLSEAGLKIILDSRPNSQERASLLQKAALNPKLYGDLWKEWEGRLPSEHNIEYLLLNDKGFNRKAVARFIADFRHTLTFAGLLNGGKVATTGSHLGFVVGDFVRWESQGVVRFEAKRVQSISEDQTHAFVEGSSTGLPTEQLTKVDAPTESELGGKPGAGIQAKPALLPKPGMNQDVFTLEEGDVTIQWPKTLSQDSYKDLEDWLELIKRKAKRAVQESKKEGEQ